MYYKGKDLADCSREELYELINYLFSRVMEASKPENTHAMALGKVEQMKRNRR